ncbi:glucose-1-phosphate adenylyltransferase large subunit 1 [Pyrus ussuriensis x Pyrus communis]|uniref:Glucose-1-phosphate adenylyltransferase large subunit 1 n=1 Tax=Pyrus ussuriensis x Pyrus communis TaxID=2448454 RepID=A0A5N5GA11_9ROSA|nr:glucose-1-phosphate adenylyltransferase large subunit 1 [Pyrus ussuriensis x Pyrus communis]
MLRQRRRGGGGAPQGSSYHTFEFDPIFLPLPFAFCLLPCCFFFSRAPEAQRLRTPVRSPRRHHPVAVTSAPLAQPQRR